jgi:hypothetical protein
MKTTLSTYGAVSLLRADTNARWSRAGAYALVEYLEQLEDDCGTEIEFDAVAIRCDYTEYASIRLAAVEQGHEPNPNLTGEQDDDDREADALEWLRDNTDVIEFDGGVIIRNF